MGSLAASECRARPQSRYWRGAFALALGGISHGSRPKEHSGAPLLKSSPYIMHHARIFLFFPRFFPSFLLGLTTHTAKAASYSVSLDNCIQQPINQALRRSSLPTTLRSSFAIAVGASFLSRL